MNSDKAAAVRDSINGCPDVVDPDDTKEYSSDRVESTEFGNDVIYTGEHLMPSASAFAPARIEQSGTVANGDGAERPVFVVVLDTLWTDSSDVRSLSPEMVYEIAKHECRIRFYPPDHRLDGDVWIVDHFTEDFAASDGDRCSECGSTYFKMRDGTPECAKCGATEESAAPEQTTLVTDGGRDTDVSQKKADLLEHDYAEQCSDCGELVFEWWDGCRECAGAEEPDTEQTTLVTDGGVPDDTPEHVPTEGEDELMGTLEQVAEEGRAQCRLCPHWVEGDDFGEILEALAEHGEEAHDWDDAEGWSA